MNKRLFTISTFKCPECGAEMYVPRKIGHERPKGHIKDLYCWKCKKVMKMQEKREFDFEEC